MSKDNNKITWKRKPQEKDDTNYLFGGKILLSSGVNDELSKEEIDFIIRDLFQFLQENSIYAILVSTLIIHLDNFHILSCSCKLNSLSLSNSENMVIQY